MSVNVHWDHVSLWFLTIASVIMYVGTRLYYLISGKSATLSGGDVNIPFSWMTIVADAGLAVLGIYLHQNFWKQTVQFTPLNDLAIQKMNKVCSSCGLCFKTAENQCWGCYIYLLLVLGSTFALLSAL